VFVLEELSPSLFGRRVGVTAERRVDQQVRYIESRGGIAVHAPVIRTRREGEISELGVTTADLMAHPPDLLVVQTGQGFRWWLETIESETRPEMIKKLSAATVWTRGTKATSACRKVGIEPAWQAPTETAADIIERLRDSDLRGRRVAMQSNGSDPTGDDATMSRCIDEATARGADVVPIDVYSYSLPDDSAAVVALIDAIVARTIDAVTFTSSPAIRHFRAIASSAERQPELDQAMARWCLPVVVGPV